MQTIEIYMICGEWNLPCGICLSRFKFCRALGMCSVSFSQLLLICTTYMLQRGLNTECGESAPGLSCTRAHGKIKTNSKNSIFFVVHNLMREVCYKFHLVWTFEKLCAKKTKLWFVIFFTLHGLFWPDLSFLPRAAQISKRLEIWSGPQYLTHQIIYHTKKIALFFEFF